MRQDKTLWSTDSVTDFIVTVNMKLDIEEIRHFVKSEWFNTTGLESSMVASE